MALGAGRRGNWEAFVWKRFVQRRRRFFFGGNPNRFWGEGKMGVKFFLDEVMEAHTFLAGGGFKYFVFSPLKWGKMNPFW